MSWIQPIGVRMIPANFGPMRGFDAHARIEGDCGDTMEAWLRVDGDQVLQATFTTDGCDTSVASGSVAAHLCQGKTFDQIRRELTPMTVLEALGLAETEGAEEAHHCADLALRTFEAAVE
ncbi:MAG TPA: iron-sulfur cluster assembly scaffold protein, partial [Holophaga sp.]|nr:iron-sulfur cluster assembly scaffold protein [Holophaga sp.]